MLGRTCKTSLFSLESSEFLKILALSWSITGCVTKNLNKSLIMKYDHLGNELSPGFIKVSFPPPGLGHCFEMQLFNDLFLFFKDHLDSLETNSPEITVLEKKYKLRRYFV